MRKAMLKKTAVYFTAVVTECSVIIETKCFFFFCPSFFLISSSSFFFLCPGSLHRFPALVVYSFHSTFGLLSVHIVCLYASQLFSACDLSHGFICQDQCLLPYRWTTSPGRCFIFFSITFFFFKQTNKNLSQKSQLPILANHTTKHCNSTNNSRI